MQRFPIGGVRVTRMPTKGAGPGFRKKHFRAVAKTYAYGQEKYKYENFDGRGSTRVVVHDGYRLDVWDYYTERATREHQHEVRLNNAIIIGTLGACIIDAIFND